MHLRYQNSDSPLAPVANEALGGASEGVPSTAEIEVTPEMISAAYAVWAKFNVRSVTEVDSDIMRDTLRAALSAHRKRSA